MAIFVDENAGDRPGHDRRRGHEAHPADARRRHGHRRWGQRHARPGQANGRHEFLCSAPSPTGWPRPVRTSPSCSCRPSSPRPRCTRRSMRRPAVCGHHRGDSGARLGRVLGLRPDRRDADRRAQLPRGDQPRQVQRGITPADITGAGPIGLVTKRGTLTYQMMYELRDIGFSTGIGIGGDPLIGTTHIDCPGRVRGRPRDRRRWS